MEGVIIRASRGRRIAAGIQVELENLIQGVKRRLRCGPRVRIIRFGSSQGQIGPAAGTLAGGLLGLLPFLFDLYRTIHAAFQVSLLFEFGKG